MWLVSTLLDLPLDDRRQHAADAIEPELLARLEEELATIRSCGVEPTRIVLAGGGAEPRYDIKFPEGAPSYAYRIRLEEKHFDVGQQMNDKMLAFYATKRTQKGKGWSV